MATAKARLDDRRRTHEGLAARLGAMSDDRLAALIAGAGAGPANIHGNQSGTVELDGAKVFVKKIALTDLERTPANEGSTANLFDLPLFYQYGVGSSGFGAWRELKACLTAGAWALSGECPYFPLVHHWRVLPRPSPPLSDAQRARLERGVAHWEHSDAIRARLEAICAASASLVLFLEHAPETLRQWIEPRLAGQPPDAALEATIFSFHDQWRAAAAFMNARGMLHFDLHRENVLTDGAQIYVADFGLALRADFDLSPAERAFFETHRLYDRAYVDWAFLGWLAPDRERTVLTPALNALIDGRAPVTAIFGTFIDTLKGSKTTPYPASELEAVIAALPAAAP